MFKGLLKIFFLWRRNDAGSIVFKTLVFGVVAWFTVGMFTNIRTAVIAGAATAALALVKYTVQHRRERAALLEMLGGNEQALKAMMEKLGKDAGGALLMEMVRAEMEDGDYEDEEPVSEEQRGENRRESQERLNQVLAVLRATPGVTIEDEEDKIAEVIEYFSDGEYVMDQQTMVGMLLSAHSVYFMFEDYCNDDDHAGLVEHFAAASGGAWRPSGCTSSFDEERDQWVVKFSDGGQPVEWRFSQSGDCLSENFVHQLTKHLENRTDRKIVPLDNEDCFEGLCLPVAAYQTLVERGFLSEG
ncbi:MAG: hypothetical protein MJE66_20725 [Proteobacteria bacterium]|nr:hypothetical protein [Pseudomonadota bacterium]